MDDVRTEIEDLIQGLKNPDPDQSQLADEALRNFAALAVEPLTQALQNATDRQQWRIINTLTKIDDPRVVSAMIMCLQSDSPAIHGVAAQYLGQSGDQRAVEPLIDSLFARRKGSLIWAIQALGFLGDRRAVQPLIEIMNHTESSAERYTAIEALGRIGDTTALDAIQSYRNDECHHVRNRVQVAIKLLAS